MVCLSVKFNGGSEVLSLNIFLANKASNFMKVERKSEWLVVYKKP